MQDRHLFRGRRLDNGEWVEGVYLYHYENKMHYILTGHSEYFHVDYAHPHLQVPGFEWIEVDPSTVGQCTGLRDRTGKLIFEGDVVELGGQYHPVKYKPMYAAFVLAGCEYGLVLSWEFSDQMEIIGTIHTTPELMEGNER